MSYDSQNHPKGNINFEVVKYFVFDPTHFQELVRTPKYVLKLVPYRYPYCTCIKNKFINDHSKLFSNIKHIFQSF